MWGVPPDAVASVRGCTATADAGRTSPGRPMTGGWPGSTPPRASPWAPPAGHDGVPGVQSSGRERSRRHASPGARGAVAISHAGGPQHETIAVDHDTVHVRSVDRSFPGPGAEACQSIGVHTERELAQVRSAESACRPYRLVTACDEIPLPSIHRNSAAVAVAAARTATALRAVWFRPWSSGAFVSSFTTPLLRRISVLQRRPAKRCRASLIASGVAHRRRSRRAPRGGP